MAFFLAAALASAGMTITWNTHPSPAPSGTPAPAAIRSGMVTAVDGTHVIVRLGDGSLRNYTATPAQARILKNLIGAFVRFRVR